MFNKAIVGSVHTIAVSGESGSGKTRTALHLAQALGGDAIAVVDVGERGSSQGYSGIVPHDVCQISPSIKEFGVALAAAAEQGYQVLVVDSLSSLWLATLRYKEGLDRRGGNGFTNWAEAGKVWDGLIRSIQTSSIPYIICCVRSKMEYRLEEDERGRSKPRSHGVQPILRDGTEYEFDVWCVMSAQTLSVVQPRHCLWLEGLSLERPTTAELEVFRGDR